MMNIIGSNNIFSNYIKTLIKDKYNIESGSSYYDSLSHYYLGRYIRDYAKEKNIPLFTFYNNYAENIISDYRLSFTPYINYAVNDVKSIKYTIGINSIAVDNSYDLVYIQVLPNDVFTLYFDSDLPIYLTVGAYNGTAFVDKTFDNAICSIRSTIKKPFTYKVPDYNTDNKDNSYRVDNLVLLIQLPKACTKRLILLGDYSNNSTLIVNYQTQKENNKVIPNINAFFKDNKSLAYLDDIIPFLADYVITEHASYSNIIAMQELMTSLALTSTLGERYKLDYEKGVLDKNMQEWLKAFTAKKISKYNNLGRVTKAEEQLLIRGGSNA